MKPDKTPTPPAVHVACSLCQKEIPLGSALMPEGEEYVGYFCGEECLAEYEARQPGKHSRPPDTPGKK